MFAYGAGSVDGPNAHITFPHKIIVSGKSDSAHNTPQRSRLFSTCSAKGHCLTMSIPWNYKSTDEICLNLADKTHPFREILEKLHARSGMHNAIL